MSVYLETLNRLAEEYNQNVQALEAAKGRIDEYEAALQELRFFRKHANVIVSVCYGKVSIFFSCDDEKPFGEPAPRAFLAGKPLYNWNGFDVV